MLHLKPLEWRENGDSAVAETFYGIYVVGRRGEDGKFFASATMTHGGGLRAFSGDSLDDCKLACEEDYDTKILSCLE